MRPAAETIPVCPYHEPMTGLEGVAGNGRPRRVLVVDDEPVVREVVVAYLEREGFRAVEAADGPAALEIMARENVNQLPVMEFGRFIGFVTRADVLRLMQVRSELGGSRDMASGTQ